MIVGFEVRPGEGADAAAFWGELPVASHRRIIKVWPEHRLRRSKRFRADRSLPPAYHLRVEPGGLHGIGPRRALAPHQQIAAAFADGSIGPNLEAAVPRSRPD